MKSTKVKTLGEGHALVYTEHLVGSIIKKSLMSFTVCAVTAKKNKV